MDDFSLLISKFPPHLHLESVLHREHLIACAQPFAGATKRTGPTVKDFLITLRARDGMSSPNICSKSKTLSREELLRKTISFLSINRQISSEGE